MFNLIFGKTQQEYESKYTLQESIERLKRVVISGWHLIPLSSGVYGKVTDERVRLYRVIPFFHNSFIPYFSGSFKYSQGRVVLAGSYSMHIFTKVFMSIWFAFVILAACITTSYAITDRSAGSKLIDINPAYLFPHGMLLFGFLLVKSGQWFSRNDISFISKVIKVALGND
jgi:hypothetical protein